jgi:DNA-directed RNA polymerase subunit RPC12/RpoP
MKTLEEFNEDQRKIHEYEFSQHPHPNGIQCPECDGELWDSSPEIRLLSNPAQKHVHCPSCGYRGRRIA